MSSQTPATSLNELLDSAALEARAAGEDNPWHLGALASAAEHAFDFLAILGAIYFAYGLYRVLGGDKAHYSASSLLACAAGFALMFVLLLERYGAYRPYLSLLGIRETERILRVSVESFLIALLVAYFTRAALSRLMVLLAFFTVPLFLIMEKWEGYAAVQALRRRGHGARRTLIYGAGTVGRQIYSTLARSPKFGLDPVGFVDDDPEKCGLEIHETSYQRHRTAKVLAGPICPQLLRELKASVLLIAIPALDRHSMMDLISHLSAAGVSTYFVPQDLSTAGYGIEYDELDGVILAHFSRGRTRYIYEVAKRCLDVAASTGLLVLFAPLLACIAVLVKVTSPGAIFFHQQRVGRNGRCFSMYKFRTMYVEADPYACSPGAADDPRITPLGRFLRRTSLDELPQLLNVLRGAMSLVGPRPEMPFIVAQYSPPQRQRLAVKPGITGLWQLSADRASPIHNNLEYDLYYVRHRSFYMDLAILLHTVLFAARGI
jgi:exopolysaccharide biosynthesis polyprenyl glycosylphosphotransferase